MKRKWLWFTFSPLIFLLLFIWMVQTWIVPTGVRWALAQLHARTQKGPIQVQVEDLEVYWLRPSIKIKNLKLSPLGGNLNYLSPFTIKDITAQLDIFQLFTGKLALSAVFIEGSEIHLDLDALLTGDSPPAELNLQTAFDLLRQWPLHRIYLDQIQVKLRSERWKTEISILSPTIMAQLGSKKWNLRLNLPQGRLNSEGLNPIDFQLKAEAALSPKQLTWERFLFKSDVGQVTSSGILENFHRILFDIQGSNKTQVQVDFTKLDSVIRARWPNLNWPRIEGRVEVDSEITLNSTKDFFENSQGKINLKLMDLNVNEFSFGHAEIHAQHQNHQLTLSDVFAQHPAGTLRVSKAQMELKSPWSFKAQVKGQEFNLAQFFKSIKLSGVPVDLVLDAEGPCEGQLTPLQISCQPLVEARDLNVYGDERQKKTSSLIEVQSLKAKGQVLLNEKAVKFQTRLSVGTSEAQVEGDVSYQEGYRVSFESAQFNFADLKNLAHLKLSGSGPVQGSSFGSSKKGILNLTLDMKDFVFEDYNLGNIKTKVVYDSGKLFLTETLGLFGETRYLGDLTLDLRENQVQGAIDVPQAQLGNILKMVENKISLPFEVSGLGSAQLRFDGPLDFWKMNLSISSLFRAGKISRDGFSVLKADLDSKSGNLNFKDVILRKNSSEVRVTGLLKSDKVWDLKIQGKNLRLEESEMITRINTQIFGVLNLNSQVSGAFENPEVELTGNITETILSDQEIANSNFNLKLVPESTSIRGSLFGSKIQTEILWPRSGLARSLKLKLKTLDWNFAPFLALWGGSELHSDYDTALTVDVDLESPEGSFTSLSGSLVAQKLKLSRGDLTLMNSEPLDLRWDGGSILIRNFSLEEFSRSDAIIQKLEGLVIRSKKTEPQKSKSRLVLRGGPFNAENLDLSFQVDLDQKILQLFMPFFEDLGGSLSLTSSLTGSTSQPRVLGQARIKDGFYKLKGFPHPFERIHSEINFSQSKILIQDLRGILAGGDLSAQGELAFEGPKQLNTQVRIRADGVSLNLPDKVKSTGSANLSLSGKWFPFLLAGTYTIKSALFEKEFSEFGGGPLTLQQNPFLPRVIQEENFKPVVFDISLIFDKNVAIKNSQMDALVLGQLQIKGSPENLVLLGKVETAKDSRLTLKDKVFEIQTGQVVFNNPNEINPEVFLSARSRINEYDVSLLVQGPVKNISPQLSSSPPLPEADIISLLALGITSTKLEQNVQSGEQAMQTATEVFGSVLNETVGKGFQNTFGLNLQLTNSYDSTKNISVPKITLSRQLGKKTSVQISRQVLGATSSDAKIQYQLNQNLSAVGSFEARSPQEDAQTADKDQQSIFGIDLEFRREFR